MITFKQYLSEQEVKTVAELIESQCKPFLDAINGNGFLYRGIKGLSQAEGHETSEGYEYAIKTVRQDRKPLDTAKHVHEVFGEFFERKFKWNPREQAVFAFGEHASLPDLKAYGNPCVIFPIGEIKYVWSPFVEDLYSDMLGSIDTKDSDAVYEWVSTAGYKDSGLDDAVARSNEIMIKCDRYFAFPIEYKAELKKALGF